MNNLLHSLHFSDLANKNLINAVKLLRLKAVLRRVNALADKYRRLTDDQLRAVSHQLRARIRKGVSDHELLPEAFAAMREAMKRTIGIWLFDVQILGAAALYYGMIAEMKTGEGKTFTAVLPLYFSALHGKTSFLVTTNNYLAIRDGHLLRPAYEFMGVSVAVRDTEKNDGKMKPAQKRRIYAADVVYVTNGTLAFDYLLENLGVSAEDRFLRGFDYAVIDEADAVLLDAAQMPLVISGTPRVQSNLYGTVDYLVTTFKENIHYMRDGEDVWLTDKGISAAERFFDIEDLFDGSHYSHVRHLILALRAHCNFQRNKQYVVADNKVKLLDGNTSRIMENTKLQGGQHQALEAKEQVKLSQMTRAMASITFQDFFNMFGKIAGMSGTAYVSRKELKEIYSLRSVVIPTNMPVIRTDLPQDCFLTLQEELEAAVEWIGARHATGQPVLVITTSINMSEIVSMLLHEMEIPHSLLNAHSVAKEAEIIAEAGQRGAVTVATSLAGRGTDIKPGEGVAELGGLAVACIGKLENKRLELQARGRSGRQGDPGVTKLFVSMEDETVEKNSGRSLLPKPTRQGWRMTFAINHAQTVSDRTGQESRKTTRLYGESMKVQREKVYAARREVQDRRILTDERCIELLNAEKDKFLDACETFNAQNVVRYVLDNITYSLDSFPEDREVNTRKKAAAYIEDIAVRKFYEKNLAFSDYELREVYFRMMTLKAIDECWIEEVDYLEQLKHAMSARQYTRQNVLYDFHREAGRSYERMKDRINRKAVRNIMLGELQIDAKGKVEVVMP